MESAEEQRSFATRKTIHGFAASFLLAACWSLSSGCSTAPAAPVSSPIDAVDPPISVSSVAAVDPVAEQAEARAGWERRLDAAVDRYTLALESYVSRERSSDPSGLSDDSVATDLAGSLDSSTLGLEALLAELDQLSAECATLQGCSPEPIVAAYSRVVRMHTAAIATERQHRKDDVAALTAPPARELGTTSFAGEMPALDRSVALLKGSDLRDLIDLNGPVNAALDDWLTWLRPALIQSYRNYLYLRPQIAPIYEEAGLPEALLFAMIATESRGKVHSTSRAGAAGLLQFMPATGRIYGLRDIDGFDQRFDPASATRANVAYLNRHFGLFNNSLEKVMAAYNGGEGRMRGLHKRYAGSSFWDQGLYYSLPRETRDYVPRILAAAWLFLHPEEYGLEFPSLDNTTTTLAPVEPIALDELAICLGQEGNPDGWFRTLRNLNPRFAPGERIGPSQTVEIPVELVPLYEERCLGTEILARARTLHDANYPPEPQTIPYTVRRGDTLSRIASRHGCANVQSIAELNRLRAPRYTIREGQRLKVPACG